MLKNFIIIGANLTGLSLALALSKLNQPTILIEKKSNLADNTERDGRAIALSYGSRQILEEIGLWNTLKEFAGEINQIRVTDQLSPLFLHFNNNDTLGYLIEADDMQKALYQKALKDSNITIFTDSTYNLIDNDYDHVTLEIINKSCSQKYSSPLLIGADGKFSSIRKLCNIKSYHHNYHQRAIVCKVWHQESHEQIAQEMFLKSGPFAILPLKAPNTSGIVWTESEEAAKVLLGLDQEKFEFFLNKKFTDYLEIVKLISKRTSYPLELVLAEKYFHNRAMLIGDSAHSIHPLAGQGFNLALRDIAAVFNLYKKYTNIGLEMGCYQSLAEYQKLRFSDNLSMAMIMNGFNALFSNNIAPLSFIRKLGLLGVNNLPILKNFFMNYAMAKKS